MKFAQGGSARFNEWVGIRLQAIASDVKTLMGDNLEALILGGGYGRGEGGVVTIRGVERPYNDLDLFLLVRDKNLVDRDGLRRISQEHFSELGVDVDFSRPLTSRDVTRWGRELRWYDLVHGHMVLEGRKNILKDLAPVLLYSPPAPIEAARLLLNRGAGLVWALRVARGLETAPDHDFVRRNYNKCNLALGDALLLACGSYVPGYLVKEKLLARLGACSPLVNSLELEQLFSDAVKFKFAPDAAPTGQPDVDVLNTAAELWGRVLLLVESKRTGKVWSSIDEYTRWNGVRERQQNTLFDRPKNFVRNARLGVWSTRYPRERLYRSLPALLCGGVPEEAWEERSAEVLSLWDKFN